MFILTDDGAHPSLKTSSKSSVKDWVVTQYWKWTKKVLSVPIFGDRQSRVHLFDYAILTNSWKPWNVNWIYFQKQIFNINLHCTFWTFSKRQVISFYLKFMADLWFSTIAFEVGLYSKLTPSKIKLSTNFWSCQNGPHEHC